jgi:N-acylglucosamine 2-epimerase
MTQKRIRELRRIYRNQLLDSTIPFWLEHGLDRDCGGYLTYLDRRGGVFGHDKAMWAQGRGAWIFSKLCNAFGPREEWLEAARLGVDFLRDHGFDADGRMFFACTRDGRPLRRRRYLFTEHFAAMGLAEYARAVGDPKDLERAREIFSLILAYRRGTRKEQPKVIPETRPLRSHSEARIIINTRQVLRAAEGLCRCDALIDEAIEDVFRCFVHPEKKALLETVSPDGIPMDGPEGRLVNPGHSLETAWFVLEEARIRQDRRLVERALPVIDWSLDLGWDSEHGGILYFVDCDNGPSDRIEGDMKLWWVHCEALFATLLAFHLSGEKRFEEWFERIHAWSVDRFPDHEYGEWYGYLHRDGSIALDIKGNTWKGPFHVPRAQLLLWQLLDEMAAG